MSNIKKIIIGSIILIIVVAAAYGCYSFFLKVRNRYIVSGYNAAIKQVITTAQKDGQVVITIDDKKTTLLLQK